MGSHHLGFVFLGWFFYRFYHGTSPFFNHHLENIFFTFFNQLFKQNLSYQTQPNQPNKIVKQNSGRCKYKRMYDIYIYIHMPGLCPMGPLSMTSIFVKPTSKPSLRSLVRIRADRDASLSWNSPWYVGRFVEIGTPKPFFSWEANILYQYKFPDTPCTYGISTYICYKQYFTYRYVDDIPWCTLHGWFAHSQIYGLGALCYH